MVVTEPGRVVGIQRWLLFPDEILGQLVSQEGQPLVAMEEMLV